MLQGLRAGRSRQMHLANHFFLVGLVGLVGLVAGRLPPSLAGLPEAPDTSILNDPLAPILFYFLHGDSEIGCRWKGVAYLLLPSSSLPFYHKSNSSGLWIYSIKTRKLRYSIVICTRR